MGAEASPLIRLLQQVTENPAALRELLPSVGEAAERIPLEELSAPDATDLMTRVRGKLAEWLSSGPASKSAPSILRSQGPTAPAPGVSAITAKAPSPARPPQMDIMDRLPAPGDPSTRNIPSAEDFPLEPSTAAKLQLAQAARGASGGPPNLPQGPSMTSPAEMLRRPAGLERQELMGRVRDLLNFRSGGESSYEGKEDPVDVLRRLKPQLQPQAPGLPPEVKAGLSRMGAIPSEELPAPSEDQPVTRYPYRGAPRVGTANVPPEEAFKTEGLKQTKLPPDMQDFLQQLISSGQLPGDVLSQENTTRALLAKLSGYKPRALMGGAKTVGEAAPSRTGLMVKQLSNLSPEEIQNVLGSIKPSGIYRLGRFQEAAEQAAPQYTALGDTRDPKEIVADLLRGGPSPTSMSEFSQKALYPILKRRGKLGLSPGEPMTLDDVLSALKSSRFIRSDQPNVAREALLAKVTQAMKQRGAK